MSDSKGVTKDDIKLFRQAIGEVDMIEHDGVEMSKARPAPVPTQSIISEQQALNQMASDPFDIPDVEIGDELCFRRSGVQQQSIIEIARIAGIGQQGGCHTGRDIQHPDFVPDSIRFDLGEQHAIAVRKHSRPEHVADVTRFTQPSYFAALLVH